MNVPPLLDRAYEPRRVEARWYPWWEERGYFTAQAPSARPPFCIVIPPPNITGSLHMGHALNVTLQDILARFRRMQGCNVLWLPGTDHAGIATQIVVERDLASHGLTREGLGREAFVDRVEAWRAACGGTILTQLRRLGASCDWTRERFTLDAGLSRAVQEVFVRLYSEGLIYRGDYVIHWCPHCRTALSDLEVEHQTVQGSLYYVHYPFREGDAGISVATTRPETILGDTGVAVHPEDARYAAVVGREVVLPVLGRILPVVADPYVDRTFGTGAVKITPAHDANDFDVGRRHGLPAVVVMTPDGRMNAQAGPYAGLDRFTCRTRLLKDLEAQRLLVKTEPHEHAVGHCYRCRTIIEPMLSKQWFVRAAPLAAPAMEVVRSGRTRIIPAAWEATFFDWMEQIRDWCISRQIWWGHRIPAWHCTTCGEIVVRREAPSACPRCGGDLEQDPDVLDTWFSSALWPFSTLGWPDRTADLATFYPTSVLVTGFDILFFWVARMMMMGLHFLGDVPFRDVYIHALVRDPEGRKMSKSKGNVIDPLAVMDRYGTDAFRFTLAAFAAQGRDIKLAEERVEGYRHFLNKLWNAARFILMHRIDGPPRGAPEPVTLGDRWIRSRLAALVEGTTRALSDYRFNEAAAGLYQFVWHEFCDWYIEMAKPALARLADRDRTQAILEDVMEHVLRLLHPLIPFATEEIWQHLRREGESIVVAPYPVARAEDRDEEVERAMALVIEIVRAVRNIRAELGLPPATDLEVTLVTPDEPTLALLGANEEALVTLARIRKLTLAPTGIAPPHAATAAVPPVEVIIPLEGVIDFAQEARRLGKELAKIEQELQSVTWRLASADFQDRAPREVIAREEERARVLSARADTVRAWIERLGPGAGGTT